MKQKGLWIIIGLLLGCLMLAGWTTWENANEVFPIQEDDIEYAFVMKETPIAADNVYKPLDEQQKKRLIDMLNQCQWKKAEPDPQHGDFREVSSSEQILYEVKLNYLPDEWKWRKNSVASLLIDKNNRVIVDYGGFAYYTDNSGNYDALLELLEEQSVSFSVNRNEVYQREQEYRAMQQIQLQLIAENQTVWKSVTEYPYYYAVTDLNQNGRSELIVSSGMSGTGLYTWSNFYEINESLQNLQQYESSFAEGESQPDIVQDVMDGYYDAQTETLWCSVDDYLKVSVEEYYETRNALCLENTALKVQCLACKETASKDMQLQTTYFDAVGNEITEQEYEKIADVVFTNFEKKQIHLGWQEVHSPEEFLQLNEKEKVAELQASYKVFSIN